jgi:hypothetical protein
VSSAQNFHASRRVGKAAPLARLLARRCTVGGDRNLIALATIVPFTAGGYQQDAGVDAFCEWLISEVPAEGADWRTVVERYRWSGYDLDLTLEPRRRQGQAIAGAGEDKGKWRDACDRVTESARYGRAVSNYVFARVNDDRHKTRVDALNDLAGLVGEDHYYTRRETPPQIMKGTPIIGIGSHGGRGLFVLGRCAGLDWEPLSEDDYSPYRHRIDVSWDGLVYEVDYDTALDGISKYNARSWTAATREDYLLLCDRVLGGQVVMRLRDPPADS